MPRKSRSDGKRRRGSRAAATEVDYEHSLAMRIFLYSPKDMIAGALALAVVVAVIANALLMQAGRHPAPMFGTVTVMPTVATASVPANLAPAPRSRPVEAAVPLPEARPAEPRPADSRAADPLTNLVKTASTMQATTANIPRPPMTVPVSTHADGVPVTGSHRIAAVQRALTEYGYGQLKPTGVLGADTLAAIQRFERARRIPVTGQVTERLMRELASTIGHSVE
nr:peptidoglycan-binding domain-containing protein [Bradyrhizobium sp.]